MKNLFFLLLVAGALCAQPRWATVAVDAPAGVTVGAWFPVSPFSYLYTNLDVADTVTGRVGVARTLHKAKRWTFLAAGDGGVLAAPHALGFALSGGPVVAYDLSPVLHREGWAVFAQPRFIRSTLTGWDVAFSVGVAKAF